MKFIETIGGRTLYGPPLSIVAKLSLLVLVVPITLSALLGWSVYALFRSEREAAGQQVEAIAQAMATRAEITVERTRSILKVIALRPSVQDMDRTRCDPFVDELRKLFPEYANVNTFNLQWEFVCSASLASSGAIVRSAYPELFERMRLADEMVLSAPVVGQLSGRRVVIAAYPVKDEAGRLVGALTAPIALSVLASVVSEPALPPGTKARMISVEGTLMMSFSDGEGIGQAAVGVAATASKRGQGTWIEAGLDGVDRVYARAPVKRTDWIALAGVPAAASFHDFERHRNQVLATLAVVLALAALLALIVARRISRPIRELQRDAEYVAGGRLAHRSTVMARDEIGQLAGAFNTMAEAIEAHVAEGRKDAEKILRLNRVYAVLSGINGAIVRIQERGELMKEVCRIAVEEGRFAKAWVGMVDRSGNELRIVASHGGDPLFFPQLEKLLQEKFKTGRGPVARSIATKRPMISNDLMSDPEVLMKDFAKVGGVRSLAALPLVVSGEAVGVFVLNSDVAGFFDEHEINLLNDLTGNIAFAIDHIEKQERIEYLASYDELTGLANRTLFLERTSDYLRRAASGGHNLALFVLDIERFKNINDSLGREAGDSLLKQVANWLVLDNGDANLVARIGADQFATVLPEIGPQNNLRSLDDSINAFLDHQFSLNDEVFRVAAKLGIALFPKDGPDAETLLRNAEAAQKKAKAVGERYVFYAADMNARVAANLTLENQLRQATEKEEFVLHYQPKIDLMTGRLTSAEALIRWNDPRTGLVPPGHFIPILEETGLILDVGRWALRKAIEDYLRWRAAGLPAVRIAVNVSPLQLRNRGLVAEIEQVIGIEAGAAAGLELEITEGVIMHDIKRNITTLQAIRALGVTVAIDDFGTGFSSLAYLSKLPVDTLKIDRSFVVDMTTGPQGMALVSTVIKLAHALHLNVVAEGVETEEQSSLLRLLGCDEMQGYLFSRPVPAADFEARFLAPPVVPAQTA